MKKKLGLSLFFIISGLLALCLVTGAFAATARPQTEKVDVVVVGGGLAGLAAAVSAAENGAKVVLLEKSAALGGNSLLSTGSLFLGGTRLQKEAGIEDSADAFYKEAMAASDNRRDPVQTRMIADLGGATVDWLISQGIVFSKKVNITVGSSSPRQHRAEGDAPTPALMNGLAAAAKKKGVRILLDTPATKLITGKGGAVAGIEASRKNKPLRFEAPAVILATGGFGANPDLVKKLNPGQADAIYAGHPGTTGDGLVMAMDKGADVVDIDVPWLTPTVQIDQKILITSNVLSKGGILVNAKAQRFTNESASYDKTAVAVTKTGEPFVYEIYDENVTEQVYRIADYRKAGMVMEAQTWDEVAQKAGLDAAALKQTVAEYNEGLEKKSDKFGRKTFGKKLEKPPFGVIKVKPGTIMTPGGLKIDKDIRVVKKDGSVIPGLYATGEATGGYRAYGYIGGDSLAHCAVTGMVAGKNAAAYAKKK
jgi:fumarate reductase flavoprotein subunit